jgi:uncharacterized protein YndB with AHSA1/START domain
VREVEPERLLRYSWRNGPLDTEVVWRLVPEGEGMRGGWRSDVIRKLRSHLAAMVRSR